MSVESATIGTQILETIKPEHESDLRSVVAYSPESYTIHHLREDVADIYTTPEVERAIEELRLETIEQAHVNNVFGAVHGDQQCSMTVFADVVELNFIVGTGSGVEVAFDKNCFSDQQALIDSIQQVLNPA